MLAPQQRRGLAWDGAALARKLCQHERRLGPGRVDVAKIFVARTIFVKKVLDAISDRTLRAAESWYRHTRRRLVVLEIKSTRRDDRASTVHTRSHRVVPPIASKNTVLEMFMEITSLTNVSDRELLDATSRAAADERRATVDLIALLAEVDARRLYLAEGYSSLFAFCTQELKLSEHEAYHRIEAARAARTFPVILERLREGSLTLTAVTLLRPHLTHENAKELIAAALDQPKREVERQMAAIAPKPDVNSLVRRLPREPIAETPRSMELAPEEAPASPELTVALPPRPEPRPISAPLSSDRYLLRVTLSADAHANLQRARDLMGHSVPSGDAAEIVERALELLVADLERRRIGEVAKPREPRKPDSDSGSRHVPVAIKREVWKRDSARCAFVGRKGRCRETGGLEFHHVHAFALGGETSVANIQLRCRAHNQYEGELLFGPRAGSTNIPTATRPGPS